jgi:hypothetical protein
MHLPVLLSLLLLCCGCVSDSARQLTTRQKYERLAQTQPGYQLLAFSEDNSFIIAVMGKTAPGGKELAVQFYLDSTGKVESYGTGTNGADFDPIPDAHRPYLLNKSGGYELLPQPPECALIKDGSKATVQIGASSKYDFTPSYLASIAYTNGKPTVEIKRTDSTAKNSTK